MDQLEQHFADLKAKRADASLTRVPNGTALVTVPGCVLPDGWSAQSTTVYFIAPVGYPIARPDTFWTDPLRLSNGSPPQNSGTNGAEGLPGGNLTWFSWHPTTWDPGHDTLLSYLRMVEARLRAVQ